MRGDHSECVNCKEPVTTNNGTIVLNTVGLCERCEEKAELAIVINEDIRRSLDFDHSMDY